ncbi:MAG: UDP-N-acetylmuramoyl-tripeptide--D-alanyl-D-alanine ligase [Pseudomonadota bacterium]
MIPLWTFEELLAATGGTASGHFDVTGVAFDSREIGKGDLFLALKGAETDGHLFVDKAFANGAAGAIVSQPVPHPHILVADTMQALEALGHASRARTKAKIIGVTGSAGKTGTKEALFAALDRSSRGRAHRSVKSYNNHVGVPLSLARMPADCDFGIFEMGMNHAGEMRALSHIVRPDVAIITTIAPAHIEFFKDESGIADAKAEIFEGLVEGGTAILPADNVHYPRLRAAAEQYAKRILSFGFSTDADVHVIDHLNTDQNGTQISAKVCDAILSFNLSQPGEHWIANSMAVLAAVLAAGGDLASAGLAMAEMGGLSGRGARHDVVIAGGKVQVIDESYNANPASMAATIGQLGLSIGGRRIAVLGAMKELGEKSAHYHCALSAPLAAAKVDFAILVGKEMEILAEELKAGVEGPKEFAHCGTAQEALILLQHYLGASDTVLVKGSNSMGLSSIVNALTGGNN